MNKNENVIIAVFPDEIAADVAIVNLRSWDERVNDVKLGVIGKIIKEGGNISSKVVHSRLFDRSMPIKDDAARVLGQELSDGRAAVVVACDDYEASMVSDSLVRDGGRVMVSTYERTEEEVAEENEAVEAALAEQALKAAADKAKQSPNRNTNMPV